jgi:hypothetical protein
MGSISWPLGYSRGAFGSSCPKSTPVRLTRLTYNLYLGAADFDSRLTYHQSAAQAIMHVCHQFAEERYEL